MKATFSLLTLILFIPLLASAQKLTVPVDPATGKISYQEVIRVNGTSKDDLYTRAREWFATKFDMAKDVIQMDDRFAGKIIVRSTQVATYRMLLNSIGYRLYYTIIVAVKDNRYRYEITDFAWQAYADRGNPNPPMVSEDAFVDNNKFSKGNGEYKGAAKDYLPAVQNAGTSIAQSLKTAMAGPVPGMQSKDDF